MGSESSIGQEPATDGPPSVVTTSIVFPIAALAVVVLSFLTYAPNPVSITIFGVALLPWALVAAGVRLPAIVVVIVTVVAVAIVVIRYDDQAALFLTVVAVGWAASEGLRWQSALGIICGGLTGLDYSRIHDAPGHRTGWAIWLTGLFMGLFLGELLHRQRRLTQALNAARQELSTLAFADARMQIAREVHDIVGHSLTVVLLNIAGARRQLAKNPKAADSALREAESISRESLDSVRQVVGLLSNGSASQTDAPLPGGGDVVAIIEQAKRSGLPVESCVRGDPALLEPAVGLTVVRLLQEGLVNAHRHAPGVPIAVTIDVEERTVSTRISNDLCAGPHSLASSHSGLGVPSMKDRVAAVNGTLRVGESNGRWSIDCVLPRPSHRMNELRPA